MKDSTRKFIVTELVLLGTMMIVSLAILVAGAQFGLLLTPKLTLPVLYAARWVVWALNQCRQRAELRPLVRRCAHYAALSLVGSGLLVVFTDALRSRPMSAYPLVAGITLCFLGGALIVWANKEFADDQHAEQSSAHEGSQVE
jgi:membrane-anchored protein YejM (alkaline phosphatase superfamily)